MENLTHVIHRMQLGDMAAAGEVLRECRAKLKGMSRRLLYRERATQLGCTELIHEVWMQKRKKWMEAPPVKNREQFFGWLNNGMVQVLIDEARKRLTKKRTVVKTYGLSPSNPALTYHLEIAQRALESRWPEAARAFRLNAIGGYTLEETAQEMGCSVSQVRRHLGQAQQFLQRHI